jgi:hypothetical protein
MVKKGIIFLTFIGFYFFKVLGQNSSEHLILLPNAIPDLYINLKISATSTGETTGHIGNLSIDNPSKENLVFRLLPCFIPSSGNHQSYVLPYPIVTTVPAGETVTVPLRGYCADVFTPPVPSDELLPPIDTWIMKDESMFGPGGIIPERYFENSGITSMPQNGQTLHDQHLTVIQFLVSQPDIGGINKYIAAQSETSGPIQVIANHITNYDQSIPDVFPILLSTGPSPSWVIAPLIIDAAEKIISEVKRMQEDGVIKTPFSGHPAKEYETIIQHTIWIYTAALRGQDYSFGDFKVKLIEQFTEATGIPIQEIPKERKAEVEKGASSFWDAFIRIGTQAKVIKELDIDVYLESR